MEQYCTLTLVLIGSSIKKKLAMDFFQFQHFVYSFLYLNRNMSSTVFSGISTGTWHCASLEGPSDEWKYNNI